ncbi:MAG: ribonuclease III [Lachnospiraceae bacterium]|nr:ribonuclease III [Lachnospiraceae bacterium]
MSGFDSYIRNAFAITDVDVQTYSPLTLAFIGDGIYDLIIRTIVVGKGNTKPAKLHHETASMVKAAAQARYMDVIEPELTPEEEAVFKRGRNANSPTMAKNASMADYRRATGFEALMGYLYLTGQDDRMLELIRIATAV